MQRQEIGNIKNITRTLFFILIACPLYSMSQEHKFLLKVHFEDPNIKTLVIGEAYYHKFKTYRAAKIKLDSSQVHENTFVFQGSILYPTAVRLYSNIDSIRFNELIFIETGNQVITIIKKNNSYEIISNTSIEKEHKRFLKEMTLKTIDDKMQGEKLLSFVRKNPDSYVGLFALINQAFKYPYPSIFEKINGTFSKKIRQTNAFQYYLGLYKPNTVGSTAPDFFAKSVDSRKASLSSFRGKSFVLLDFWASWCGPCRQMMPHLKELYQKYHAKGFEIISISVDTDSTAWRNAVKKEGIQSWINVMSESFFSENINDPGLGMKYSIWEYPTSILINKKGTIIGRYADGENHSESDLDMKLAEIFK